VPPNWTKWAQAHADRNASVGNDIIAHIFTRSKLLCVGLPAQAPASDVYYDMKALRPPPPSNAAARSQDKLTAFFRYCGGGFALR
jgi:hypothetical protein